MLTSGFLQGVAMTNQSRRPGWISLVSFEVVCVVCLLAFWGVYWISQWAVKCSIALRREKSESLLHRLEQQRMTPSTPGRFTLTTLLCTLQETTSADTLYASCNHRYWARG